MFLQIIYGLFIGGFLLVSGYVNASECDHYVSNQRHLLNQRNLYERNQANADCRGGSCNDRRRSSDHSYDTEDRLDDEEETCESCGQPR